MNDTISNITPRAPDLGTAPEWEAVLTGAHVSLVEYPSGRSSALRWDELEDPVHAAAHDPVEPGVVDLGLHGLPPDADLRPAARHLGATTEDLRGHVGVR